MKNDEELMRVALNFAKEAVVSGDVPVGAIIVRDGEIIASGKNCREKNGSATGHAEIDAINAACEKLGRWRLSDCELFVTLEPCPMCAGAIINSRMKRVVFGAFDEKSGACASVINLFELPFNHRPEIVGGILAGECKKTLTAFFQNLRKTKGLEKKSEKIT